MQIKKIFPIIVLYKCTLAEARSYVSLLKNADGLESFMLYDNSPASYTQNIDNLPSNAIYVRDTSNSGLAKAYNAGAQKALELGYTHLLVLDQDTFFPKGAWEAYNENLDFNGVVAPQMVTDKGVPFSPSKWLQNAELLTAGDYSLYQYCVANSGICVPLTVFNDVGGYDLKVYLDYSDRQFLRRVRVKYPNIRLMKVIAQQDFSGDCRDYKKLLPRFILYLDSVRNFTTEGLIDCVGHSFLVFKHSVALTLRTHNPIFLKKFFTIFVLNRK